MKTIKIFLASSEELKQERLEIADLVENLNMRLEPLELRIQLVKWEYLDSSMGSVHKQEEYNEALKECELCIVMYWRRFGDYTTIELDTAYQGLCAGNNPRKLYVYFKDMPELSPEIMAFRDGFPKKYGHFYSFFQNIDTLKTDFLLQFIDYQKHYLQSTELVELRGDGQIRIGGQVFVDLTKVPFAGNNEEYQLLLKNIKKTQKLLSVTDPADPDYRDYAIELNELKDKQKAMEDSLWSTALMITKLSSTQCSERLARAKELFMQGDCKGTIAVLNEDDIERDAKHNIHLIQLGEEGRKGLNTNIDEWLLKIEALQTEKNDQWFDDVNRLYCKCLEFGRGHLSDDRMSEILFGYGLFLQNQNLYKRANLLYQEALEIYRSLAAANPQAYEPDVAMTLNNLAALYSDTQRFEESEAMYREALEIRRRLAAANPQAYEPYVAGTLNNLANLYYSTQRFEESEAMYREALEIHRRLATANPQAYEPDVAGTLNNLAVLYSDTQRFEESESMYREALEIRRRLAAANPQAYEPDVAATLNNLAALYYSTQRLGESEEVYREALEIRCRLAAANPQAYEPDVARTLYNLAILYKNTRRFGESEAMYREALEIHRRLAAANPQAYEPDVAMTLNNLAALYYSTQRFGESEAMYSEALEIHRRLAAANPQAHESDVALTLNNLAILYKNTRRFGESEVMYREALEIHRRLAAANPQAYEPDVARTLYNLAILYYSTQRFGESEAMYREALEIYRRIAASNPQAYESDVAQTLNNLAILYKSTQRYGESEAMYREALEIYKRLCDNQPDLYRGRVAWIQYSLMYIYGQDNTHIELYDQMLNDALANWEVLYAGNDHYKDVIVDLRNRKGWRLLANNEINEALKLFESAYQLNSEESTGYLAAGYNAKAYEYTKVQDFGKAIETIDKAITLIPNEANYYGSKGEILLKKGDEASAVEMWKKVMALDPDFLSTHNSDLYKQLKERGLIE